MTKPYSRRQFIRIGAIGGGAWTLASCTFGNSKADETRPGASTTAPATGTSGGSPTSALFDNSGLGRNEVVTDPSAIPSRFKERPEFAEMVAAGTLPPVEERIGEHPLVIQPLDSVGKYGGTLRRAYTGTSDFQNPNNFCAGPDGLLYWDFARENVVPNIALDYEMDDAGTELILHLRHGMHWSDGQPFTADDIVLWRNEINLNPDIGSGSVSLRAGGQPVTIEKVDDFTVRYTSPVPHPLLPGLLASTRDLSGLSSGGMAGDGGYAPMHYLSQFHPAYTSVDEANRLAAEAGVDGWPTFLKQKNSWFLNPELPVLGPWVISRPINDPPLQLTANPYSIWVDTEGNQLPYIGEISMDLVEQTEVITLRATAGDLDFQDRHLQVASLSVLLDNESRSGCTLHRTEGEDVDFGIRLNLAYDRDPVLGELIRTTDFRRALSLAIDRDQVNEAFFVGTGTPTAMVPADFSPYFPGEGWRTKWATLDVEQANALLDGIGLTARDGAGMRLRPDGSGPILLDYQTVKAFADFPAIGEMIRGQWAAIGIDMHVEEVQGNLLIQRSVANEMMLSGHTVGSADPFLRPESFLPTVTNNYPGMMGIPYALWFATGGAQGVEPPPPLQKLKDSMDLYQQGLQASEEERIKIGKELYMIHADEVYSIGVVGFAQAINGLYYAKNTLKNVPETARNSIIAKTPSNLLPMTFYYE